MDNLSLIKVFTEFSSVKVSSYTAVVVAAEILVEPAPHPSRPGSDSCSGAVVLQSSCC